MSIDTTPVTVDGLVLETPMLGYGRESVVCIIYTDLVTILTSV